MASFQRFSVFMVACVILSCQVSANNKDLSDLDAIFNEKECIMQGGLCVVENDCPSGQLTAVKGLCPEQRSKGVECCYSISVKETRCSMRGGSCTALQNCGKGPRDKLAKDCKSDEVCCIYVK